MDPESDAPNFLIWGVDNVVYGPVDLVALVNWIKEERVTGDTWVFLCQSDDWRKASQIPELQMFFRPDHISTAAPISVTTKTGGTIELKPGSLRRVKILSGLSEEQLRQFVDLMQLQRVEPYAEIVTEGSPGDAMYLILEGEVRVRLRIAGKETILATLTSGEFFGEVALFDHGARSADVVANSECVLLRVGVGVFQRLVGNEPGLAAPFLYAIGRTLISRIRADNKRYRDSIAFARGAGVDELR